MELNLGETWEQQGPHSIATAQRLTTPHHRKRGNAARYTTTALNKTGKRCLFGLPNKEER